MFETPDALITRLYNEHETMWPQYTPAQHWTWVSFFCAKRADELLQMGPTPYGDRFTWARCAHHYVAAAARATSRISHALNEDTPAK